MAGLCRCQVVSAFRVGRKSPKVKILQNRQENAFTSYPKVCYSSQAKDGKMTDSEYCLDLVRKRDYENYLCCLLLPQPAKRAVLALRAFNVETAQVADSVSEKQIGHMRMQFWKDALENICKGTPPQTPVAVEMAGAIQHLKLSKQWLSRIIQARSEQLTSSSFRSLKDVEKYGENTSSSLLYLTLESLGVRDVQADHAASHVGKAQGLVTMLRAAPHHCSRGQVLLPIDILLKHQVAQEDLVRGSQSQEVKDVMFDIAAQANVHLEHARQLQPSIPRAAQPAFLSVAMLDWYLKMLQQVGFDVFSSKLQQRNHLLPLKLWLQSKRGKF